MKTVEDIFYEIDIPCFYCEYLYGEECSKVCVNTTLSNMFAIAEEMVLRGEY